MEIEFNDKSITFDKELNALDRFVIDFTKILEKHTLYIIVSGYVAILFGRARATDDIDITIPKFSKNKFEALHKDIVENGYWFLNAESIDELFDLLETGHSIRAARKGLATPNIEIKFAKSDTDFESLKDKINVRLAGDTIYIGPLELQVAYKEVILGSGKDIEDALHLREIFGEYLDKSILENHIKALKLKKKHGEY